jgi:hypothetical protein
MGAISIWHWLVVILIVAALFWDWRWTYDWYPIRRFLRKSKFQRWKVPTFASRFASAAAIQEVSRNLDTYHLQWAVHLSDHTVRAKSAIRAELERRGASSDLDRSWLPNGEHVTAPAKQLAITDVQKYIRRAQERSVYIRILRTVAVAWLPLVPLLIIAFPGGRAVTHPGSSVLTGVIDAGFVLLVVLGMFWVVVTLRSRALSLRFSLLRPFGHGQLSKPLRKLVPNEIGPYGVAYTLADKSYERRFLSVIGDRVVGNLAFAGAFTIDALFRPSRRIESVYNERTFLNLARKLTRVLRPNNLSFYSGGQALSVKANDELWKLVVYLLVSSNDVLIIDLSQVGSGLAWELELLERTGRLNQCLLIAQEGYEKDARSSLPRYSRDGSKVHVYAVNGRFLDRPEFQNEFHERIRIALRTRKNMPRTA